MLKKNEKKAKNQTKNTFKTADKARTHSKNTSRIADKTEYQKREIEILTFMIIKDILISMMIVVVDVVDVVILKKKALCVLIFMFWCFSH